jgi:hypothetical protein
MKKETIETGKNLINQIENLDSVIRKSESETETSVCTINFAHSEGGAPDQQCEIHGKMIDMPDEFNAGVSEILKESLRRILSLAQDCKSKCEKELNSLTD